MTILRTYCGFFQRLRIVARYYHPNLRQMLAWVLRSEDTDAFSWDMDRLSKSYMLSAIADITGKSHIEITHYADELKNDVEVQALVSGACRSDQRRVANIVPKYGRYIGWYAIVRALKPACIVETHVDEDFGTCILSAALARNKKEGAHGAYYGVATHLETVQKQKSAEFGKSQSTDLCDSIKNVRQQIDLLIIGRSLSPLQKPHCFEDLKIKLADNAIILDNNAYRSSTLLDFALDTGRHVVFIHERPHNHWYQGDGFAVAFPRMDNLDDPFAVQLKPVMKCFGARGADWIVCPDKLTKDSVMYSLGVGKDISFDMAMIAAYGLTIHAFDPTPESVQWISGQPLPDRFNLHEVAVSDTDGAASFYPPENPSHVSHSLLVTVRGAGAPVCVPTKKLSTLMLELGHTSIDVLKMDIEGAEYAVIADMIHSGLDVRQLLVEFHHRFRDIGIEKTKQTIELLRCHGYDLYSITADGLNYSFLRRNTDKCH